MARKAISENVVSFKISFYDVKSLVGIAYLAKTDMRKFKLDFCLISLWFEQRKLENFPCLNWSLQ